MKDFIFLLNFFVGKKIFCGWFGVLLIFGVCYFLCIIWVFWIGIFEILFFEEEEELIKEVILICLFVFLFVVFFNLFVLIDFLFVLDFKSGEGLFCDCFGLNEWWGLEFLKDNFECFERGFLCLWI